MVKVNEAARKEVEMESLKGLKVLLLTNTFAPEPGALRGLPFAKWLNSRGANPTVLTAFPSYPLGRIFDGYSQRPSKWFEMDGIPVLRTWVYPSHDTSAVRRILTYLSFTFSATIFGLPRVGKPDVIFYSDNTPTTGLVALLLKKLRGVPYVWHIGDLWPDSVTESGMIGNVWLRSFAALLIGKWCMLLYRNAAAVSVLSPGFKSTLISRGVPSEKICVIPNWADEDSFFPSSADSELSRQLGLSGKINFVYAGNMGPLQDLETVVRAAKLVEDLAQVQIVLIGTGPHEDRLKALASELGTINLRFVDRRPVEEMNAINACADVLLVHLRDIPLMRSTIPSKIQVAFASARPILLAVQGDAARMVEDSGGGIVVEPSNPEALADAIRELSYLSRSEREDLGRKGRAYYERELSMDVGANVTANLLLSARRFGK